MAAQLLQSYFESINFLPLGEKIGALSAAIEAGRKIGKGKRMASIPAELEFLAGPKLKELNYAIYELRKKQKSEIEKFEEMKKIFRLYGAKIGDGTIKGTSYPDGLRAFDKVWKHNGFTQLHELYFTCDGMQEWFRKNVGRLTRPFRDEALGIEDGILNRYVFGVSEYAIEEGPKKRARKITIPFIQPVSFFEARWGGYSVERIGKGTSQPLKRAHLLMLFYILKMARDYGIALVEAEIRLKPKSVDETAWVAGKRIYADIAKIAPHIKKPPKGPESGPLAVFQKK